VLLKIEKEANITYPTPVASAAEKSARFVSPDLRHHKADGGLSQGHGELASMASTLYQHFLEVANGEKPRYELIDEIARDFGGYQSRWNTELIEQIHALNEERADYRIKFFRIYKSWSWHLAKPVWLIEKMLRKY
jgi:hypothetical protein